VDGLGARVVGRELRGVELRGVAGLPESADGNELGDRAAKKEPGAFAPRPDGVWRSYGKHVEPRSLYLSQFGRRG
jgi:hypothetical protein